jgi:septum formation protein
LISTSIRTLILASSSPRRQELIHTLQLPVQVHVSHADETVSSLLSPAEIVETLSLRKAQAVKDKLSGQNENGIIIGSDTIVVLDEHVLGKPVDAADAQRMLGQLQGRQHRVFSGIACIDMVSGEEKIAYRVTNVHMKSLTSEQIERYIATGEPMDKAGSYAIQGIGATLIDSIEGCYFNVVGLPLSLLSDMLSDLGVNVL